MELNIDKLLFEFDLNGFCILPNFLLNENVGILNELIDKEPEMNTFPKFQFLTGNQKFVDLIFDPRVLYFCKEWINPFFRFDHAWGVQYKPGEVEGAENLHAGPYQNQGFFQYHWHQGRPTNSCLLFCYILKHQPKNHGGLVFLPGSHKSNLIDPKTWGQVYRGDFSNVTTLFEPELNPGDLVIMSEACMHGTRRFSSANKERRNLYYKYCYGSMGWLPHDNEQIKIVREMTQNPEYRKILEPPYVSKKSGNVQDWRTQTLGESFAFSSWIEKLLRKIR